ncbi:lysophospholipid acyltransferase family protein [Suttonella ornithocola]|uniref:1-acyl-sn-glycerol-3-phosphate acyltransferase n=1 Tax=Suttonella ornithocola TaxID=279832 RepID=A0A380MT72_9GAMM|nr:1-acylglycerol-3-phosphate O-acyltransferase [Suttonella ornithocola]SUO95478.1 1-acyl-sn-glycerol-3-phosphate acyltransferase [Suttonella ornithocola]
MLRFFRKTLISLFILISFIPLSIICLIRPRHPNNAWIAIKAYSSFGKQILGLDITIRGAENLPEKCIYVVNHQSNIDIFSVCYAVPKRTVTLGKKSILYMPIFGQIYWLSGNLFIVRGNARKSAKALKVIERKIHEKQLSIWIFPEGTRNFARGLLPFKTGAFRLAAKAGVAIVPVCVNNYYSRFDLNQKDNGEVIVEFQKPIIFEGRVTQQAIREMTETVHQQMEQRIEMLTQEARLPQNK